MTDVFEDELDDVFGLVADRTRLEILRVLWEERTERDKQTKQDQQGTPVSFSTLRERVGVEDSGRFNYHLNKLVPRFVADEDDGYSLTYAGVQIFTGAVSGIYTETDVSFEPRPAGDCPNPDCDGQYEIAYESGVVSFGCDTCEDEYQITAPPILVGAHDLPENPDVVRKHSLTVIQKTARGFCHLCSGPLETEIQHTTQATDMDIVAVEHECQECGTVATTSAMLEVLDHPAVVSALHEAGIDYREAFFEASTEMLETSQRIVSEDPVEIEISVDTTEVELTLLLDEELSITEYTRSYPE